MARKVRTLINRSAKPEEHLQQIAQEGELLQKELDAKVRTGMSVVISLSTLAFCIVLVGRCDGDAQKWALGTIGLVIGYWLRVP